jgi:hypothetical protein
MFYYGIEYGRKNKGMKCGRTFIYECNLKRLHNGWNVKGRL